MNENRNSKGQFASEPETDSPEPLNPLEMQAQLENYEKQIKNYEEMIALYKTMQENLDRAHAEEIEDLQETIAELEHDAGKNMYHIENLERLLRVSIADHAEAEQIAFPWEP